MAPEGYSYYKVITITGQVGAGTGYQVKLSIDDDAGGGGDFHLEGHCISFPDDIRFTNNNGETNLDYWIEEENAGAPNNIVIWVEVDADLGSNQTIRCYYNHLTDESASCGEDTFGFFDGFASPTNGDGRWWRKYASNPIDASQTGFDWSMFKEGSTYYRFYRGADGIYMCTSANYYGAFADDVKVLSLGAASSWDDTAVAIPIIWKESSTYYMLYCGWSSGERKTGSASYSGDLGDLGGGTEFTKNANNPIIDFDTTSVRTEVTGIIKIGSTYRIWFDRKDDSNREVGTATTTDTPDNWDSLSFTEDGSNPIFDDDRFGATPFKRGDTYYLLVCHYTSGTDFAEMELYSDSSDDMNSPATLVNVPFMTGSPGEYDDVDIDLCYICFDVDDLTRTSFMDDILVGCYGGYGGANIYPMLIVEEDIDAALQAGKWTTRLGKTRIYATDGAAFLSVGFGGRTWIEEKVGFTTEVAVRFNFKNEAATVSSTNIGASEANDLDNRMACITSSTANRVVTWTEEDNNTESNNEDAKDTANYHTWEIQYLSTSSIKFYYEDGLEQSHTTRIPDGTVYPYLYAPAASYSYVKWILVRKCIATEPSFSSAGVEKDASSTGKGCTCCAMGK